MRRFAAVLFALLVVLSLAVNLQAQTTYSGTVTMTAGTYTVVPGMTVNIPVVLSLNGIIKIDSVAMAFVATPSGGSPGPTFTTPGAAPNAIGNNDVTGGNMGWATSIAPPSTVDSANPGKLSVLYVGLSTKLGGTTTIGNVKVTVPVTATAGQTYAITIPGDVSASTGTTASYTLQPGAAVTVTVSASGSTQTPVSIVMDASAGGNNQTGTVNTLLANPFIVTVTDGAAGAGNPIPNIPVVFAVTGGGGKFGTVTTATVYTDNAGQAFATLKLGTSTASSNTATAAATGITGTVNFTATANADVPAAISKVSGDTQSAAAGSALANPLIVQVNDQFGNPIPNIAVVFANTAGGGTLTPANGQVTTGTNGRAQATYTVGSALGANTVTASATGLTSVSFGSTSAPPANAQVLATAGDGQNVTVAKTSANLTVTVKTAAPGNAPIQGAVVNFTVTQWTATLSAASGTTDANGQASITLTAPQLAGTIKVQAAVGSVTQTATFTVNAVADVPASLAKVSGDSPAQSAAAGTALTSPFVVIVKDQYNNPVSGASVQFAATAGGGTLPSGGVATTGADGKASITYTVGSAIGGNTVTATVTTLTAVSFTATSAPPANAQVLATAGTPQNVTVAKTSTALTVTVKTAAGAAIQNAVVNFTVTPATATLSAASGTTDANGQTSVTVTAPQALGTVTVTAAVGSVTQTATFTLTAVADVPASIAKVSGDTQSAAAGTALTSPFVVIVKDQFNNPVSGASVQFAATAGGGTLPSGGVATTGADGKASITYTVGSAIGGNTVTATVTTLTAVSFTATSAPPADAQVLATAGTPQNVTVAKTSTALTVTVKTAAPGNVPIQNAVVNFTVTPATATLSAASGTTDANGQTSVTVTAPQAAGTVTVTAAVGSVTQTATFTLTAVADVPASIAKVSGDAQSAAAGTALTSPFVVIVKDQFNNPVSGASVQFAATAGGGTLPSGGVATTGTDGKASITYTVGSAIGGNTVTATVTTLTAVSFTATSAPPANAQVLATAGTPQNVTVATASTALTVTVKTAAPGNVPIQNAVVNFTVTPATATLSAASGTTDANGQTSVTVTAPQAAGTVTVTAAVGSVTQTATFTLTAVADVPASIAKVSGDAQNAAAGAALAAPLIVIVKDQYNNPVSGATVQFAATAALGTAGTFTPANGQATTGSDGKASIGYTVGAGMGTNTITAGMPPIPAVTPVTFTAISNPPADAQVLASAGTPQNVTVAKTSTNLTVTVKTAAGAAIQGAVVNFSADSAAATLSAASGTTDANGQVSVTVTVPQAAGLVKVTGAVGNVTQKATFNVTAVADVAASIAKVSGDTQNAASGAALGQALVVIVKDQFNNVVSGATVQFAATVALGTAGTFTPANGQATTGADGKASINYTVGAGIGINTVTASVTGVATAASFTAIANPPADAQVLATAGTPQNVTVTQTSTTLTVTVKTAAGAVIQGAVVNFTTNPTTATPSAASGTTDANGQVSITATVPQTAGTVTVTGAVAGVTQKATFTLTATADVAASIAKVSGDTQNAYSGVALAQPLVVIVKDQYNNPVSGATVQFAATAAIGAAGAFTPANGQATTGTNGQASIIYSVGTGVGTNTVTASVTGVAGTASFTEIANPPANSLVAVVSGSPQSTTVTNPITNPLVVSVKTAAGAPIQGATVTFTASPAGRVTMTAPATTDANGQTQVNVTVGQTSGAVTVTASVAGVTQTASFTVTGNADVPVSIAAVGPTTGLSALVNTSLPVSVVVKDQYGNGVPQVTVNFVVTKGAGSVTAPQTNANGIALASWVMGSSVGENILTASVTGIATTITFNATSKTNAFTITASQTAINEMVFSGTGAQLQRSITVDSSPTSGLTFFAQVSGGGPWLKLSATAGSLPATIVVTLDSAGLAAGAYTGSISFGSTGASNSVSVPITFTVKDANPPVLNVSPGSLSFTATQGAANPTPQAVFVINGGSGVLGWSASASGGSWLAIDQSAGSAPSLITASANITGLAEGTYQGTISVRFGTTTQTIGVTLTVQPAPVQPDFVLDTTNVVVQGTSGSTAILTKTVNIGSSATPIKWTAVADPSAPWLSLGTASGTTPSALVIQVNPAGVAAGQYAGAVLLTAQGVTSKVVNVNFTAAAAPLLVVYPSVISFAGTVGGALGGQAVEVRTSTGDAIPYTATLQLPSGRTWLSGSPLTGSTVGSVSLTPNPGSLPAGTYAATLTVTSPKASNSATATVLLQLSAPNTKPTMDVSPGGVLLIASAGGSPVSQSASVTGSTGTAFTWSTATVGGSWLTAMQSTSSGNGTITITGNPAGLATNLYQGQVIAMSGDTVNASVGVSVAMLVVSGSVTPLSFGLPVADATASNLLVAANPGQQFVATAGIPRKIEAFLVTMAGKAIAGADVTVKVSNETNPITLTYQGNALYAGVWTPRQSGSVVLRFSTSGATEVLVTGSVTSGTQAMPSLNANGAVNGASFAAGLPVTAGSIVSIFGTNLAASAISAPASGATLPTTLGNAAITVNGIPAPLFYVSGTQINVQIPFELAGQNTATIRYASGDTVSVLANVPLASASPGIFLMGATTQGAIIHQDGSVANSNAPATSGEYLSIYMTGLGDITNPPATGARNFLDKLSPTKNQPTVTINGLPATVQFSGLAPGFVALYQINVQVPTGIPAGNSVPVAVKINGMTSNTANIAVK